MKKYLLLFFVIILMLSACDSSVEVSGIENFSENTCSWGLNMNLLPGNAQFLSDYPYENGDYYYWTDGNYNQAKTFVRLQYQEDVYQEVIALCKKNYIFSEPYYTYDNYTFSDPIVLFTWEDGRQKGMRMFGYNNGSCEIMFIGSFGYAFDSDKLDIESDFNVFFKEEFSQYY